ncbi:hypothetical protein Plhal304r1_c030g0098581 [Plasmopara halstedii]
MLATFGAQHADVDSVGSCWNSSRFFASILGIDVDRCWISIHSLERLRHLSIFGNSAQYRRTV